MAVKEAMLYSTEETKVRCAICAHQCEEKDLETRMPGLRERYKYTVIK